MSKNRRKGRFFSGGGLCAPNHNSDYTHCQQKDSSTAEQQKVKLAARLCAETTMT